MNDGRSTSTDLPQSVLPASINGLQSTSATIESNHVPPAPSSLLNVFPLECSSAVKIDEATAQSAHGAATDAIDGTIALAAARESDVAHEGAHTEGHDDVERNVIPSVVGGKPVAPKATRIQFVIVCGVLLVDSISTSMLFSYVGLLVTHIDPSYSRSSAGYVSGMLIGLFQGAQIFSLPFWGGLSDTVGRKPVLLISLALSALVAISFGLASSLWMAFVVRFFHGLIVAGAITVKSYITEITDESNAAKGFSMMSLARSFGSFAGPSIGGLLYDPIRNNPSLVGWLVGLSAEEVLRVGQPSSTMTTVMLDGINNFTSPSLGGEFTTTLTPSATAYGEHQEVESSFALGLIHFLRAYPAFLPGLVLATYATCVGLLVARYMVETNPNAIPLTAYVSTRLGRLYKRVVRGLRRLWSFVWVKVLRQSPPLSNNTSGFHHIATDSDEAEGDGQAEMQEKSPQDSAASSSPLPAIVSPTGEVVPQLPPCADAPTDPLQQLLAANKALNERKKLSYYDVWTHPILKYVIPMYMCLTGYNIGTLEVVPLYAIAFRRDGGLELSSAQVGGLLMSGAVAAIIANTLFSSVAKRVPLMRLWMICNCMGAISTICLATTSLAAGNYTVVLAMVAVINLVRTTSSSWCFSMYNMFVANVAPKKHLGAVTAMVQATGAMARCVSPAICGAIFAWSIAPTTSEPIDDEGNYGHHMFPFNHYFVFMCTASLALVCMLLSRRIDADIVTVRHK